MFQHVTDCLEVRLLLKLPFERSQRTANASYSIGPVTSRYSKELMVSSVNARAEVVRDCGLASRVQLLQVHSTAEQSSLKRECSKLSRRDVDNFWLSRKDLEHPETQRCCVHAFVAALWCELHARGDAGGAACAGAEVWVQKYDHGKGLAFHFDKDEALMRQDRAMSHPLWSSVFYLTGKQATRRQGAKTGRVTVLPNTCVQQPGAMLCNWYS